jgi:glyoxylate/hydroxypyruvate reductase A
VLGFGHLGRSLARALVPLGYAVRSHSRTPPAPETGVAHFHGPDGLGAFLAGCDILVNLLPMTAETRGILSRPLFDRLPTGARLVHLGRGGQLVEADLLTALDEGRLAGASLDVFPVEPLPEGHPFWRDPRIVVTPHVAAEADLKGVALTVRDALAALAEGRRPATEVDADAGY